MKHFFAIQVTLLLPRACCTQAFKHGSILGLPAARFGDFLTTLFAYANVRCEYNIQTPNNKPFLLPCSLTALFCASREWKVLCFLSCAVFLCCFSLFYLYAKQVSFEFVSCTAYNNNTRSRQGAEKWKIERQQVIFMYRDFFAFQNRRHHQL